MLPVAASAAGPDQVNGTFATGGISFEISARNVGSGSEARGTRTIVYVDGSTSVFDIDCLKVTTDADGSTRAVISGRYVSGTPGQAAAYVGYPGYAAYLDRGEGANALPDLWSSTTYGTTRPCTTATPVPGVAIETGNIQVKDR